MDAFTDVSRDAAVDAATHSAVHAAADGSGERSPDSFAMVRAFHERMGVPAPPRPDLPPEGRLALRVRLLREEQAEFERALAAHDLAGAVDALADLVYVTIGAAVELGVDLAPVFEAVHEANMRKVGGARRADGKVLKPEGWRHPDVAALLRAQGWRGEPPSV